MQVAAPQGQKSKIRALLMQGARIFFRVEEIRREIHMRGLKEAISQRLVTTYIEKIPPKRKDFPISAIRSQLSVSRPCASEVRAGKRRPHPRHWKALAQLVGVSVTSSF